MLEYKLSSSGSRQTFGLLRQNYLYIILAILAISECCLSSQTNFLDSSSLKPSIILIVPQSFKVPLSQVQLDDGQLKPQQFVAVINNIQNDRDDRLLRQQYKKLALQVRDAKSPITGQLFYEHIFDYFTSNSQGQHLLVPVNLDQVSPKNEHIDSNENYNHSTNEPPNLLQRPTQLIVSIRPYQLESGFGSENIEFVSSAPIPVEPVPSNDGRRSFAIVQTDKPIYKPDEKVRIRSLVINEILRPVVKDEIRLQIRNPQKIIVEEIRYPNENSHLNQTIKDGFEQVYQDHVFEFPPEPMLGFWTVQLLHNDPIANDTISFEVREYVLPTYEIVFDSPKYILPSTYNITGSIVTKYHYGKPVQGKAQFKFGYKESANAKPRFIARSSIKTVDPVTGRVDYKIGSEKFKDEWFPGIAGSRFVVEATVTEMSTGHREIAQDTSCTFLSLPYRIAFDNSIEDFKPGLSQQLTVQLLEAQTNRHGPANARIRAYYQDQNKTALLGTTSLAAQNQPVDFRQVLDEEAYTDSEGRATFNIGPILKDITSIHVTLKWDNSTAREVGSHHIVERSPRELPSKHVSNELAIGHHTLTKHESFNGWIAIMNKSVTYLSVGQHFSSDLLIRDAVVIPHKIFYLIIARSQIVALNTLNPNGLIEFNITEEMLPAIRIVLFALTHDSVGLMSDSMRINVNQELDCGLSISYESNLPASDSNLLSYRPNDKGKLLIHARQGDSISLIGVDAAVYTLNKRSQLESSKIVQRIKRLDSGCGFGGGKNNLDVFHNAGLMFFKEVTSGYPQEIAALLGSSCLTVVNQLRHLEDIQLGYARPMFTAATQFNRPRMLELALAGRHHLIGTQNEQRHSRVKRSVDVENVLKRYKDPLHRLCCRLGTHEDLPQRRNCSVRARIVERYMRQPEFKSCHLIYNDCCRTIFGEQILFSSMLSGRAEVIETRVLATKQEPQQSEAIVSTNIGHLDMIEAQTLIRKDFRETWLFDIVKIDQSNGGATLDVQLPHSITAWSVSAMALNVYRPMCLMSKPLKIRTFQEIFLQVAMPYKVMQGEQIDLVVTVFNYSPQRQEVFVYMYGVEGVCSEAEPNERSDRKRIRIEKHASQSILFPMIPLKVGKHHLKIVALTLNSSQSDIIERVLNVVPKGKPVTDETTFSLDPMNQQRRSKRAIQTGNLMDEIDSSKGLQKSKVRLMPTRDSDYIVPQSQECIVSVIGDKLGQSVQTAMIDVENLIRLPHGCGEQVMIYLGPTLYTARYLSSINKLTGDSRWRAIRYIQSGYKRILNYRKENGAFSAFARRDPSIWLTAFIAKMLCQTEKTPFIADQIHVDKNVINSALSWLIDVQNKETGTWIEMNPVYHREMLGGVLKENALTAFVTLTLNECAHHSSDLIEETEIRPQSGVGNVPHTQTNGIDKMKMATQQAEQTLLLDRYKAVKEKNPYVLALTAYALSFSRPREAASILGDLILLSDRASARNQLYWRGDYQIETAAYALQALIELAPIIGSTATLPTGGSSIRPGWSIGTDSIAISNWLASRRSYSGAFESTQDTVVALEALSKFAQFQSTPNGNAITLQASSSTSPSLVCNVTIGNRTRRSIEFGKDNSQILQVFRLETSLDFDPMNGEMLDVVTSGNGLGTMSVKLKYNVYQEDDELCRFNIDSSIEEWRPKISDTTLNKNHQDQLDHLHETKGDLKDNTYSNNETIEDDYFKTFDKSMLSELNLVDLNQLDLKSQQETNRKLDVQNVRKEILRLRRRAPSVLDLSSKNDTSKESWTSKVVSSFKAGLPSWLTPKTTTTAPVVSTSPNDGLSSVQTSPADFIPRKTNTTRRSTHSSVPMIIHPTGIPIDAKLNPLSKQYELDQANDSSNANNMGQNVTQAIIFNPNRLVLLLRVCVHHMSSRRDSEMAVIEVGILSGFKPNEADLKEILNDIGTPAMKYEISADRSLVIIYMQYIPFSGPYCLQFRLVRDSLVYNLQSGYIRVYEYYSPVHSCSNLYTPSRMTDLIETKCDSSGQVCQCASKSLCPPTSKLLELGETHSTNATRARNQLVNLICSDRYDIVSLVRLKNVRHLEVGKMFKLSVKVISDLKGNLTKVIEAQRSQKVNLANSIRKPNFMLADYNKMSTDKVSPVDQVDEEDTTLDYLNLNIDSSCVKNDPFLLHLAHPNQWKQGGEMILFGSYKNLEKRFFRTTAKSSTASRSSMVNSYPKPKPTILSGSKIDPSSLMSDKVQEAQMAVALFEDAQQLQYSVTLQIDKDSILHDITYQSKSELRESIKNIILWLELRSRREKWTCPSQLDAD